MGRKAVWAGEGVVHNTTKGGVIVGKGTVPRKDKQQSKMKAKGR